MNDMKSWLISTAALEDSLAAPDLVVVDASWFLPQMKRNGRAEYLEARIPGAIYFDIDEIADTDSELPHMLPGSAKFSSRMRQMGIGDGARIVVYDSEGINSAARAWWTFRVMGADDVRVLDGGLRKWRAEDRPIDSGPPIARGARHFTVRRNATLVAERADVMAASMNGHAQILDARSPGRFAGTDPEPRAGLRGGHIPSSLNLPFNTLQNADGTLKSRKEIQELLRAAGIGMEKPIVTTCGSGVTACILALAIAEAGGADVAVYDGSWAEWGADPSLPIKACTG